MIASAVGMSTTPIGPVTRVSMASAGGTRKAVKRAPHAAPYSMYAVASTLPTIIKTRRRVPRGRQRWRSSAGINGDATPVLYAHSRTHGECASTIALTQLKQSEKGPVGMDTTGERYVPDHGWANIAYEHLSRYLFAQPLAVSLRADSETGSRPTPHSAALIDR